jgi:ACR3 family arsenite transporter
MTRAGLERHQVLVYLAAILAGLAIGGLFPAAAPAFEALVWPALGVLLYATFTQVPLTRLSGALRDRRFMAAVLAGNFLLVPVLVWGLLAIAPGDAAIRLGIAMVLLVPCTDWYITFTHLSGGDTRRAIAVTPVNLIVQIAVLPFYLWLFLGDSFLELLTAGRIATVFVILIVLPLLVASATQRWAERRAGRQRIIAETAWLPVPLLGLVVFLIAASQVHVVLDALSVLWGVAGLFAAFLVVATLAGAALGRIARLTAPAARALIFSLGTRNSFVVLPLALALAPRWQTATIVIVVQSLVELFGMIVCLWIVPRWLAPDTLPGLAPVNPRNTPPG